MAIGATNSVFLLRSRPVHDIRAEVHFEDPVIRWQYLGSCSGLVDLDQLSHFTSKRSQSQQQQPRDVVRCDAASDIMITTGGGGELTGPLSKETTFCAPFRTTFNYSIPRRDPLQAELGNYSSTFVNTGKQVHHTCC